MQHLTAYGFASFTVAATSTPHQSLVSRLWSHRSLRLLSPTKHSLDPRLPNLKTYSGVIYLHLDHTFFFSFQYTPHDTALLYVASLCILALSGPGPKQISQTPQPTYDPFVFCFHQPLINHRSGEKARRAAASYSCAGRYNSLATASSPIVAPRLPHSCLTRPRNATPCSMERTDSLLSMSSTSSTASRSRFGEPLLPYTEKPSQNHSSSIKAVFGHCMYKRVIVWTVASFSLIALFMYNGRPDRSLNPAYGQEDLVIIPQQTPSQFPPQMDLQMPPQFPSEVSPQIVPDPAPHIEPVIEHKIEAVPQTGADKGNAVAPGTVPQKAPNAAAGEGLPASIFNADDNARMDSSSPIILAPVDDGVQKPAIGFTPDQLNQEEDLEERRKFEMEANAKPWLRFLQ